MKIVAPLALLAVLSTPAFADNALTAGVKADVNVNAQQAADAAKAKKDEKAAAAEQKADAAKDAGQAKADAAKDKAADAKAEGQANADAAKAGAKKAHHKLKAKVGDAVNAVPTNAEVKADAKAEAKKEEAPKQ